MGRVSEEERNKREKEERKPKGIIGKRGGKEQREEEICKLKARQDPDG